MISQSTIARHLDAQLYTVKHAVRVPSERNSERTLRLRRQYVLDLSRYEGEGWSAVYFDECGYNMWTAKNFGRSPKGARAYHRVAGQRGGNVTVAMAVSRESVVHWTVLTGFGKAGYKEFLIEVKRKLMEIQNRKFVVIVDNCPFHTRQIRDEFNAEDPDRFQILHLPPWSPFLSPIEEVFSKLKSLIKQGVVEARPVYEDRSQAAAQGMLIMAWRKHILEGIAKRILEGEGWLTAQNLNGYFDHAQSYRVRSLEREPINN